MPINLAPSPRRRFPSDQHGATAVEYALLASLIAGVIAGVVATVGIQVLDLFTSLVGAF